MKWRNLLRVQYLDLVVVTERVLNSLKLFRFVFPRVCLFSRCGLVSISHRSPFFHESFAEHRENKKAYTACDHWEALKRLVGNRPTMNVDKIWICNRLQRQMNWRTFKDLVSFSASTDKTKLKFCYFNEQVNLTFIFLRLLQLSTKSRKCFYWESRRLRCT